ncbi:phosphoglycolate phosphatase [Spirochaetia bacterium]|nr:phosphoglycolate phosphatase [Spirochaetia bacterium]
MKYKGIIFDCDGTLVDTLGDISASMNLALKGKGYPALPVEAYSDKVGWGIKRLAFLCLPEDVRTDELAAQVAADASGFYAQSPLAYTKPYPGIPELIAELKNRKLRLAVLTNKPDSVARLVIDGIFSPSAFDVIYGDTKGRPRKPDPACAWEILADLGLTTRDTIMVGDSEVDIETAKASECYSVGVTWGYRPRSVLEGSGAKLIIDKPEEILTLL